MAFYIVVHGGAGFHSHESEKEVLRSLRSASSNALSSLQRGASSLEAVEKAITIMEDAEPLNAGYGSNLTELGAVECDASIMDGAKNFGSVGALSGICNPITVARAILDNSLTTSPLGRLPPMILVAGGAYDFAAAKKLQTTDPTALVSPRARNDWLYWKERVAEANVPSPKNSLLHDTVGAVALDCSNGMAAGVSSGGILYKIPGRLGEASFFGAGCWADNALRVACSVSGTGEAIIRLNLARKLCETLVSAENPEAALLKIFDNELTTANNHGIGAGAILLIRENDGRAWLWCLFNTPSMAIGLASSENPQPQSLILRHDTSKSSLGKTPCSLTVLPWRRDDSDYNEKYVLEDPVSRIKGLFEIFGYCGIFLRDWAPFGSPLITCFSVNREPMLNVRGGHKLIGVLINLGTRCTVDSFR